MSEQNGTHEHPHDPASEMAQAILYMLSGGGRANDPTMVRGKDAWRTITVHSQPQFGYFEITTGLDTGTGVLVRQLVLNNKKQHLGVPAKSVDGSAVLECIAHLDLPSTAVALHFIPGVRLQLADDVHVPGNSQLPITKQIHTIVPGLTVSTVPEMDNVDVSGF